MVWLRISPDTGIYHGFTPRRSLHLVVAEVREHFGDRVYDTVIPRTVRVSEAPRFGKSILEYDTNGTGARAYRALAGEFIRRHSAPVS